MMAAHKIDTQRETGAPAAQQSDKCRELNTDPAIELFSSWLRAQHVSMVLCRLQQRLERRVLDASPFESVEEKLGYAIAYQAEIEAMTAALKFQDRLPATRARSLLGIVAKLEMIVGADREIDDPTEFPWPHIASVLQDLRELAGRLPVGRPDRSTVHSDCRQYQVMAARLIALEKQVNNPEAGGRVPPGTHSE